MVVLLNEWEKCCCVNSSVCLCVLLRKLKKLIRYIRSKQGAFQEEERKKKLQRYATDHFLEPFAGLTPEYMEMSKYSTRYPCTHDHQILSATAYASQCCCGVACWLDLASIKSVTDYDQLMCNQVLRWCNQPCASSTNPVDEMHFHCYGAAGVYSISYVSHECFKNSVFKSALQFYFIFFFSVVFTCIDSLF